jgi:hypothetical protein
MAPSQRSDGFEVIENKTTSGVESNTEVDVTVNGNVYSPAEDDIDQSVSITINGITYVPLIDSEATIDTNDDGGASKSCYPGDFDRSVSPSFKMTVNANGVPACFVLIPQSKS